MCLILIAYKVDPSYDLCVLANRDEFYKRPSETAHWWEGDSRVLAGKDLKAGGTWLGVTESGNFCALTNYRDPSKLKPEAQSRGDLVIDYLKSRQDILHYQKSHLKDVSQYNDFNILFYEENALYYFSSIENQLTELEPGVYGLSNHLLDTEWPKVENGKAELCEAVGIGNLTIETGFQILSDKSVAPDNELPETGVPQNIEKMLSAMHIESPEYGTRSSNVIFFGKDGKISFAEKDHLNRTEQRFEFEVVSVNRES